MAWVEKRRNLWTNPRLAVDSTGYTWTGTVGGTSGRVAISDLPGFTHAYQITRTDPATGTRIWMNYTSLVVGEKYTASFWARASGRQARIWVGTGNNTSEMGSRDYALFPGWQRVSLSFTATATSAFIQWRQNGSYVGSTNYAVTGFVLEKGTISDPTYFDGDYPDTTDTRYHWATTANASQSFMEVDDVPYYRTGHSFGSNTPTTTSITMSRPTAAVAGDILMIAIRSSGGTGSVDWAPPTGSGFVRMGVKPNLPAAGGVVQGIFWKKLPSLANEPQSYTFTGPQGRVSGMAIPFIPQPGLLTLLNESTGSLNGSTLSFSARTAEGLGMTMWITGGDVASGSSSYPTLYPDGIVHVGITDSTTTGVIDQPVARSTLYWGYRIDTTNARPLAAFSYGTGVTNISGQQLIMSGGATAPAPPVEPTPSSDPQLDSVPTPPMSAGGKSFTISAKVSGQVLTVSSARTFKHGFQSVPQMLGVPGATWIDTDFTHPEMSRRSFEEYALDGFGMFEFYTRRSSDGWWFGMWDSNFDRTALVSGSPAASTLTKAQILATYQNRLYGGSSPAPYWGLTDFLDTWAGTHVLVVRPQGITISQYTEFLDLLDSHGGASSIVLLQRGDAVGSNLAAQAVARGYHTIGVFLEADVSSGLLHTNQSNWAMLSMESASTQATWNTVRSYGKPVVSYRNSTQAQYDTAISNGAKMVHCYGRVKPVSSWNTSSQDSFSDLFGETF